MLTLEEAAEATLRKAYDQLMQENPDAKVCPLCKGDGLVGFDIRDPEHPAFGRGFRCPCKDSWGNAGDVQESLARLFGKNQIPKKIAGMTFDIFKALPLDEYEKRRVPIAICQRLARDGVFVTKKGIEKRGIVLSGIQGAGKSSLAVALSRAVSELGYPVLFKTWGGFVDSYQATYNRDYKGPSKDELIKAATRAKVIVLDDVGAMQDGMTPDERRILYRLIDGRHSYGGGLITVITTNLKRERFKGEVDPRTYRRVRDLCVWVDMADSDLTPYGQE